MKRIVLARALCALAGLSLVAASAPAQAAPAAAWFTAQYYRFAPGWDPSVDPDYDPKNTDTLSESLRKVELHMSQGSTLIFTNLDNFAPHSIVAVTGPDQTPLFETKKVIGNGDDVGQRGGLNLGESSIVDGAEALSPGKYAFVCGVHSNLMFGRLYVDP